MKSPAIIINLFWMISKFLISPSRIFKLFSVNISITQKYVIFKILPALSISCWTRAKEILLREAIKTPHKLDAPWEKNPLKKSSTQLFSFLILECVCCKRRIPLWSNLLLKYSITFILFLNYCNPITLFAEKVKLLLLTIL